MGTHHLPILCQDGITLFPIQVQPMSNGGTNTSGVVRKVSGLVRRLAVQVLAEMQSARFVTNDLLRKFIMPPWRELLKHNPKLP